MDKLEKLYDVAYKENIGIYDNSWSSAKARIFDIDNLYLIAFDKNKLANSKQEKQILAEEMGHYYCNALYYLNDGIIQKSRCEYRARKWAYQYLIPINKLIDKINDGIVDTYELADYFDVEPNYMYECINFYKEIGMLRIPVYN